MGNIKTTAGAEVYDLTTGRLMSRTDTAGTWTYTYDRAGNLVQAVQGSVTWIYGYDALDRLRSVWRNGAYVARYGYDVLGRRIAKRATTKLGTGPVAYTRFVYRGANVAFETDSLGSIGLRYVWGPAADDLIAIRDGAGNQFYVVQDRLRSVRGLVRRDGTWLMSQRFGPYGAVAAQDIDTTGIGFVLRYAWTGREFDVETGFYYFRARYYDLAVRRFVQEDPIGYGGGGNLYAYAGGNPVERRDPSGMMMEIDPFGWRSTCGGGSLDGAPVSGCLGIGLLTALREAGFRQSTRAYLSYFSRFFSARDAMVAAMWAEADRLVKMGNPWDGLALMNDADGLARTRPFTFDEFVVVEATVDALGGTAQGAVLESMLGAAQIGINNSFREEAYAVAIWLPEGLAFITLRSEVIRSVWLQNSTAFVTNIMLHEGSHITYPSLDADALACGAVWAPWRPGRRERWCV